MITAVIVYLIGVVVTWMYAGYNTGRQFHKVVKANPSQPVNINWMSVFYQGLTWVGFWASLVGETMEKHWGSTPAPPTLKEVTQRVIKSD
jgi:hypothetical protein